jgi:hypothetical protein
MMSEEDKDCIYAALYLADALEADNRMMDWLNHNGFCNLTVCPMCRVDDFTHVEGCKMGERLDRCPKQKALSLIAAAPELLETLKSLENDNGNIPLWLWEMRNKAIAKAEGRT